MGWREQDYTKVVLTQTKVFVRISTFQDPEQYHCQKLLPNRPPNAYFYNFECQNMPETITPKGSRAEWSIRLNRNSSDMSVYKWVQTCISQMIIEDLFVTRSCTEHVPSWIYNIPARVLNASSTRRVLASTGHVVWSWLMCLFSDFTAHLWMHKYIAYVMWMYNHTDMPTWCDFTNQ